MSAREELDDPARPGNDLAGVVKVSTQRRGTWGAIATVVAVIALGISSGGAQAHPIRECGGYGHTKSGDGPYFMPSSQIYGAGVYNITSRAVTCRTAHRIVKRVMRCGRAVCYVGTFKCRTRQVGYELADTRCRSRRSRHYVVHWQSGA